MPPSGRPLRDAKDDPGLLKSWIQEEQRSESLNHTEYALVSSGGMSLQIDKYAYPCDITRVTSELPSGVDKRKIFFP